MIVYHLMALFSIRLFGGEKEPGIRQGVDLYILCEKSQSRKNIVEKYNKVCFFLPIGTSLQIIICLPRQFPYTA